MPRTCPICKIDNRLQSPLAFSVSPWELKSCVQCGFVYLENPPEYAALKQEFAWEKTYAQEVERRRERNPLLYKMARAPKQFANRLLKRDKLVSWVKKYVQPGPVLDVGSAGGHTLEKLPAGYTPFGIEVSEQLSRIANEKFAQRGGRAVNGIATAIHENFPQDFFSGIIMSSFLEHEIDPGKALASARETMKPGSRLIVKVPNFACWNRSLRGAKWCGFRHPDHVNYFTPESLEKLVTSAGFRIARFGLADRFPTSDNMWMLAEKGT